LCVAGAWRDHEIESQGNVRCHVTHRGRSLGEHQSNLGAVRRGLTDGGVMNIENKIGALRNELRASVYVEALCAEAGIELSEKILTLDILPHLGIGAFIRNSIFGIFHPVRS